MSCIFGSTCDGNTDVAGVGVVRDVAVARMVQRKRPDATIHRRQCWKMNAMFSAVVQATEESVVNALAAAKTMTGANSWTVPASPHDQLQQILRKHGQLKPWFACGAQRARGFDGKIRCVGRRIQSSRSCNTMGAEQS